MENSIINRKDRIILGILQEYGRMSCAEIARRVGLAASRVIERIKKQGANGVILGRNASLDRRILGLSVTAFIAIKTSNYVGGAD